MLEIIKIILENISKSLSVESIRKAKKEKRLNAIGTEIFLLYASLNSILVVARHIVRELESGLNWMIQKVEEGEPDRELFTKLPFLLRQQEINILEFIRAVKHLGMQLQVIAPEAYVKLHPLIHGKLNAISRLIGMMSGKRSSPKLVTISDEKLQEVMKLAESGNQDLDMLFIHTRQDPLEGLLVAVPIDDISHIPAKNYRIIEDYLRTRNPVSVIAEIEVVRSMLRKAIEANFSLQDILLQVGDQRSALVDSFIGF